MVETLITAVCSLVGSLSAVYFANRKNNAVIEYRLNKLEDSVNNLIDKEDKRREEEKKIAVMEEQIHVINHRIKDLEGA